MHQTPESAAVPDPPAGPGQPCCLARAEGWLDQHGDAMYGYARLRLSRTDLAEDAVQEALLAAVTNASTFEGRSHERTWLIGILRYKVLDILRKEHRERTVSLDAPECGSDGVFRNGWFTSVIEDWSGTNRDPVAQAELRTGLVAAIEALPPTMRSALCLREIDGLPTEAVCDVLGVTPTNLWTLVHRAKARCRDYLQSDVRDAGHDATPADRCQHGGSGEGAV